MTNEERSVVFLLHLLVAVQRGNATSVLGSISKSEDWELYLNGVLVFV